MDAASGVNTPNPNPNARVSRRHSLSSLGSSTSQGPGGSLLQGSDSASGTTDQQSGSAASNTDAIKVICRFRPNRVNRRESLRHDKGTAEQEQFRLDETNAEVEYNSMLQEKKMFKYDKVFGQSTTQTQVFEEVRGVVDSVMAGFNGTVMAYGQTSAGKSYTMEGLSLWDEETQGLIPRCVDLLFEEINNADTDIQFQVIVSFFEIYCEKVRDLLNPQQINLKIRETKDNGFIVQDVTEIYCTDRESVLQVIEFGKANRASAPTLMNAESSRSHSIVSIVVDQRNAASGRHRKGSLFLVDLAGSEKVSKTGASGMRLEEAKNINSSLTTLGMVINALCDGAGHVPYRDSKLTMILGEALGGNSRTTLIICCTAENKHTPETLSTLRFGERAKKIKNHAKVNEELSVEELKVLLAAANKEIVQLKKKLKLYKAKVEGSGGVVSLESMEIPDDDLEALDSGTMTPKPPRRDAVSEQETQELRLEVATLKAQVSNMEEEMETERLRFKEEHEQRMLWATEAEALKGTIADLEEKLIKANLSMKKVPASRSMDQGDKDATDSLIQAVLDDVSLKKSDDKATTHAGGQHPETSAPADKGANPQLSTSPTPDSMESHYDVVESEVGAEKVTVRDLEEHSLILQAQLEEEIRTLNRSVNMQASEARSAHATAQQYAEKYLKLREDYELHVQRLMLKLTQEQQARTIVEDQLDNATRKIWQYESREDGGAAHSSRSNTLFSWFSKGASSIGMAINRGVMTEREQNMARTLELSQLRIAQLIAEHEALNEAHSIVLETKESVMRNLSRQNTELSIERDNMQRRIEELMTSVDQLTNLLRSVQQNHSRDLQHPSVGGAGHTLRIANVIKGGGSNIVRRGSKPDVLGSPMGTPKSAAFAAFADTLHGRPSKPNAKSPSSDNTDSVGDSQQQQQLPPPPMLTTSTRKNDDSDDEYAGDHKSITQKSFSVVAAPPAPEVVEEKPAAKPVEEHTSWKERVRLDSLRRTDSPANSANASDGSATESTGSGKERERERERERMLSERPIGSERKSAASAAFAEVLQARAAAAASSKSNKLPPSS